MLRSASEFTTTNDTKPDFRNIGTIGAIKEKIDVHLTVHDDGASS
jgi:hypothetical protein